MSRPLPDATVSASKRCMARRSANLGSGLPTVPGPSGASAAHAELRRVRLVQGGQLRPDVRGPAAARRRRSGHALPRPEPRRQPYRGPVVFDDQGAVISSSLWRRLARIQASSQAADARRPTFTITGVTPPGFRLPAPGPGVQGVQSEIRIPLILRAGAKIDPWESLGDARIKPAVTFAQAEADVSGWPPKSRRSIPRRPVVHAPLHHLRSRVFWTSSRRCAC